MSNDFRHLKSFPESNNTVVFTTKFVIVDKHDITLVRREPEDNALTFVSNDHYDNYEDVAMIVGLGELIEIDRSLLEISDIKIGFCAYRNSKRDEWIIKEIEPND